MKPVYQWAAALCGAAVLAGCASKPTAEPALAAGAASLEAARSAGAPELAAVELNNARNKLERARALAQTGEHEDAIRLAEQADVDAQLARAKASSERSLRAVAELEAGLRALREELSRPGTAPSPSTGQATPPAAPGLPK